MFLSFLVLVGFCFARPSPDGSLFSTPTAPLTGFPAEYLPSWNYSGDRKGSLFVPLYPGDYHHLEQRFARGPSPAGDFRGGQLITSIFAQLDPLWKSTAGTAFTPIVHIMEERNRPFLNVLHTIRPSSSTVRPEAVLTPLKVGIVYCWMMRLAVEWPSWSGHIVASIYNGDAGALGTLLGWINVENLPQTRTESTPAASGYNDSTAVVEREDGIRIGIYKSNSTDDEFSEIPKAIRERSWLECCVLLMVACLQYSPSASIVDNIPAPTGSEQVWTLHYRSTVDPKMEANVTVFRDESRELKFHHMVEVVRGLVILATERDMWDNSEIGEVKPERGASLALITFGRTWRDDRPHQVAMGDGIALSQS
ncbi:MAG: hypothetical protein Q9195_006974 [Heterodermia aff. obscurata]